ncbi:hypothetical protein [Schlesneria sp. T3-172]|uniref:hypothetical protein n=1 Tax=Schlesneria sphaerica TaxID=3373610 RepID=UPI0037C636F6
MSRFRWHEVVWLGVLFGLFLTDSIGCLAGNASGAEPLRPGIEFERADFPADQPNAWPKEVSKSVAVPRDEFVSLVEKLNARTRGPRPAWLKSAHYEAILVDDTLVSGLMTASVQRLDGPPSLLELGPFSFAIKELKWQNRSAIWGSSADGRAWVLTDERSDELLGEWTCAGRKFPGGIDFDLQLPEATTSFLDLRIPRAYIIDVPGADVTLLSDAPSEATRLWRIQCGNNNRCRLTCVSSDAIEPRRNALLVEHDMHVVVREEDVRFQLVLNLEALDAPIREFSLRVPAGLTIYSVVYGSETPIQFQRVPETDPDGKLLIRLPGPLLGRGRTLRIDGMAVKEPDRPAISPQIIVENSTFSGGRQSVIVQSPLQIRSIRSTAYRQLTPLMPTSDGESLMFQQLSPEAQLILDVHRPPVTLTGQMLGLLIADEDSWMLDTEITWTSPTVGGFRTSCLFPPQWEITDVQMADPLRGAPLPRVPDTNAANRPPEPEKLIWDVKLQEGGQTLSDSQSLLAIEFLEAIQPGQPRAVRVIARRRPPEPGQVVSIPLPQLLNCDTSEVLLGIEVPNSMTPDISDDARFERIPPPPITPFPAAPDHFERRWFRGDALEGGGTFKVTPQLPPVQVKTETVIEAFPSEYRVRYTIQYQPRLPNPDRLLIYLTESNTDVRWSLKGSKPAELSASRLKKSEHVEWNLPPKGELWEIRLPRGIEREFTVEGNSTNRWSSPNRPALAIVPHAIEKIAQLKLNHPDSLQLTMETDGLKSTGERSTWWYATPEAIFGLEMRNPEPSKDFPLMVSMQLSTLMTTDDSGFDLYRARLQLENGSAQESMRIKLAPDATLQDATVDGQSIAVNLRDGEFVVPGLNATRKDAVELIYRVPAHSSVLYEKRRIIVPEVSAQVLVFHWDFTVPPSARLFAEPSGARLSRPLPSPTWQERLFGPLGRSQSESIFHPFYSESWYRLFQPHLTTPPALAFPEASLEAAAEGQRHEAVTPGVPTNLSVELWHTSRIKLLTWISFGVCLTLGIGLRMIGWSNRDRFAAYVLGLSMAATFSAPMPYAGFLGGAVAGTLIALLIPRRLLTPVKPPAESMGSSLRTLPATLTACLLGGITFAGLSLVSLTPAFARQPGGEAGLVQTIPRVYIPVDEEGNPSESLPFVYVPKDVLSRWKELASERGATPDYLISAANYELRGTTESHWNILASYVVHLLPSSDPSVLVELALADVSLPDAESCLVNGKPSPIGSLPNGKGYSIELMRPESSFKSDESVSAADELQEERISTFRIELRLRKPRPGGRMLDLAIPSVVNSHLTLLLPEPYPYAEVTGARGASERDPDRYRIETDLGLTSLISARWGQSAPPPKVLNATASMLQHLELRPSSVELRFHLVANVEEGSLEALEFELPTDSIVRRVHSRDDDLLRSDVIVLPSGQRRLRLIFESPRRSQIIVDGTLLLIQADSLVQTVLPRFGLAGSETLVWHFERNWWGISAPSDFRVEAGNLDPEYVNSISPESYLQAWIDATAPVLLETVVPTQAQTAFELRAAAAPTFSLVPYQPRRRAMQWRQSGSIGKRRMEWSLVGEIETSLAPVFQTVLDVDRRLRVEKVSVIENGAERRIRWAESRTNPSRIVIFHDKTQGRQTISLRGSLPIRSGVQINLPFVRPEDCDVTNSKLTLTRDPEVDVVLTPARDWKADTEGLSTVNFEQDGQILLGRFLLTDPVVRGTIQTSSRHSRCTARATAVLRRADTGEWNLKYRIQMTPEGESPMRMGLNFPETFTAIESVTVDNAEPAWRDPSEGGRQLDLLLNRGDGSGTTSAQFEMTLAEPKASDWGLPLPVPLNSNTHETLLVIEPEDVWFAASGREVRVADLPQWSTSFFQEIPGAGTAFRVTGPSVRIQRDVVTPHLREASVRLLDQRMWLHWSGQRAGITQAFLSSVRTDLDFELPAGTVITAIFLDDHPLPLMDPVGQKLTIPMTDAGTESLLTLAWTADSSSSFRMNSTPTETFPWPTGIRLERNLITILPDDSIRLWARSGLTEVNSFDQGLDRLETLLERHQALGPETRGAAANRWRLDQLQTRLLTHVTRELSSPTKQTEARLQRRSDIIAAIDELEPVPDAPQISWQSRLLEEPPADCEGCIRGLSQHEGRINIVQINDTWLLCTVSCLLALILVPLLRQVIRVKWGQFLDRHISISWLLLALIWWFFLTPSAFGPLLMIVLALRMLISQTSRKPATTL